MEQRNKQIKLSALIVAHNEEARIEQCLKPLDFADEIVVVLDKCTDKTEEKAKKYTSRFIKGAWDLEGDRRNAGIEACHGQWIVEVDADEVFPKELGEEIKALIQNTPYDYFGISVHNYVGERLIRYGLGASFTAAEAPRLFRKGAKIWGKQRVHPSLIWTGKKGPRLKHAFIHYMDRNISDMIRRLDSYSTARAKDLAESGKIGYFADNLRRVFSRFFKCYVRRKGYKEGYYGFLIALFAGLFPMLSFLKARLEYQKKEVRK